MMVHENLFGRLVIAFIFGPPFGTLYLAAKGSMNVAIVLLVCYLGLSYPAIKWLDQKNIVRKWLSAPIVACLSVVCMGLLYAVYA